MLISEAIAKLQNQLDNQGNRHIAMFLWNEEDVKGLDESLTDKEIEEVLFQMETKHDAEQGVNWDLIKCHIDDVKNNRTE